MKRIRTSEGFTLVELMIVVAIIGILAAIMLPKMGSAVTKANEATTKGNLGSLRSAITIFYAENEHYPTDNLASLVPTFIKAIPELKTTGTHDSTTDVITEATVTDSGQWSYNNVDGDQFHGTIVVGCTHNDASGHPWDSF